MNTKTYGIIGLLILGSITVFSLYNDSSAPESAETVLLKIGLVGALPGKELGVSIKEGYLDDELAKVNARYEIITSTGAGNPIAEFLGSKSIDISDSGDVPILHTIGAGIDVEIIAIKPWGGSRNSIVVLNGSGIKSVKDLKGKKVAGGSGGGNAHLFSWYIVEKYGLSPKNDVTWVNLESADAVAALLSKQVDAAVIGTTTIAKYEKEGSVEILFEVSEDPEWPGQDIHVVRREYGIKNPGVVTAFLKAQIRAQEWIKDHPDEYLEFQANTSKISVNALKRQFPGSEFIQSFSLTQKEIDKLNRQKANLIKIGIHTTGDFDVASRVNRTYLEAALKDISKR
ncbi:MAG: ABC transporter substrate-binding protein [Candidatus Methanoperedens sp.]|nr:ABC transporter substrate-binding protein [Candidatus Methanoperedens sp.]